MTISEIRNIHPLVADLVCQRIREQGNEPDERYNFSATKNEGGFNWEETPEGGDVWYYVHCRNFEPLFSLYPELRGGKPQNINTELALKVSKFIHEQCAGGVPHDIGLNVLKLIENESKH